LAAYGRNLCKIKIADDTKYLTGFIYAPNNAAVNERLRLYVIIELAITGVTGSIALIIFIAIAPPNGKFEGELLLKRKCVNWLFKIL
jgi:hypothetical protein